MKGLGGQAAATAAKSLRLCPTLCDPIDGRPPGSSVPGILQARILEWVAISFSNACMRAKSLQLCLTSVRPCGQQPSRILCPQDSLGKNTGVGCHSFSMEVRRQAQFRFLRGFSWGSRCLPRCLVPGPSFSLPDLVSASPHSPTPGPCPSTDQMVSSVANSAHQGLAHPALGPNVSGGHSASFALASANSRCLLNALQYLGPQSPKIRVEQWFLSSWRPSQP